MITGNDKRRGHTVESVATAFHKTAPRQTGGYISQFETVMTARARSLTRANHSGLL